MKKKTLSELKLQKTTISHLNGGICKCDVVIPGNGIQQAENELFTTLVFCPIPETHCCHSRNN